MTENDKKWILAKKEEVMKNVDFISEPAAKIKAIKEAVEMIVLLEDVLDSASVPAATQNMGSEDKVRSSDNMKRQAPKTEEAPTPQTAPAPQAVPAQQAVPAPQAEPAQQVPVTAWTEEAKKEAEPLYNYLNQIAAQPGGVEWLNNQLSQFTSGLYVDYTNPEMPPQTLQAYVMMIDGLIKQMNANQQAQQSA